MLPICNPHSPGCGYHITVLSVSAKELRIVYCKLRALDGLHLIPKQNSRFTKLAKEITSRLHVAQVSHSHISDGHHHKNSRTDEHCSSKSLIDIINQLGPEADFTTYAYLLRRCTIEKAPSEGALVHHLLVRHGHVDNIYLNNLLLQMYSKCGSLQQARALFDNMFHRNLHSWTIMLAACAQNGHGKEALTVFGQMQAEGLEPDIITSICVLDACANVAALEAGREIHARLVSNGWESDVVVGNALVNMYGKCGSLNDARPVFAKMPGRDVVSWNSMITVYAQNGHGKEVLQIYRAMQGEGFEPDNITAIGILDACATLMALEEGSDIHACVVGYRWESDVTVQTALINMYAKCRSLDDARAVFTNMPWRDAVSWNAMIAACAQNEHGREALQLYGKMQAEGFDPSKVTTICVLDACVSMATLDEGREIHASVVGNGWEFDVTVGTSVINMYGKGGSVDDAMAVFAELPQRNVVSWNAMIAVCAQNGHGKKALHLFDQMEAEGFQIDKVTFLCVLTACSHMGLVADGQRYFASMTQNHGILPSMEHYMCMIDLLGRAGLLERAEHLIPGMPAEQAASAWVSLLSSCRIHGDVERGVRAANFAFYLDERNASPYVLLANICENGND